MFLCSGCGEKLTNRSVYFVKDFSINKRTGNIVTGQKPVCKDCRRRK